MQEPVNGFKQFEGISCELTTQQAYEVVKMVDILLSDVEDKHHALAILFQIVECPYDISSPYMVSFFSFLQFFYHVIAHYWMPR